MLFETPLIVKIRTTFKKPEVLITAIMLITASLVGAAAVGLSADLFGGTARITMGMLFCFYLYCFFNAVGLIMIYSNARKRTDFLSTAGITFNIFVKAFITAAFFGLSQWLVMTLFDSEKNSQRFFLIFTALNLTYIVFGIFYIIMLARVKKTVRNNYPHRAFLTVCLIYIMIKALAFSGAVGLGAVSVVKRDLFSIEYWRIYAVIFTLLLCATGEILKFILTIKYKRIITINRILVKKRNV